MRAFFRLSTLLLLSALNTSSAEAPADWSKITERLKTENLKALHDARAKFAAERQTAHIMPNGVYDDYRAVLNVKASAAELPDALAAAKKAGVSVIVFSDKEPAKTGMVDGMLLLPGSVDGSGALNVASTGPAILSSTITFQPIIRTELPQQCRGFQICSQVSAESKLSALLIGAGVNAVKSGDPTEHRRLVDALKQFPNEFYAASQCADNLEGWDAIAGQRPCCCVADNAAHSTNHFTDDIPLDSYERNFKCVSTHILAREFNEKEIRKSLAQGRSYVSYDSLCDPTGFVFGAGSMLGTFVIGDNVPYYFGSVKLGVFSPLAGHIRILREGKVVAEADGNQLLFDTKETGVFRSEVWLKIGGELRPWIFSNPIYLQGPSLAAATQLKIPLYETSPEVFVKKDIPYTTGAKEDEQKHQLDIFRPKEMPKDKKSLPVFMFVHGGSWRTGDRWQYLPFGNFLAKNGILAVIPSYRLAPQSKFPAQIEDTAAAFKWTVEHCAEFGGDPERIYIGGHSAGGHLASLLTFDTRYLEAQKLTPKSIKGAIFLSGVYDLVAIGDSQSSVFGNEKEPRRDASPLFHVKPNSIAPHMLISCCQHDYLSLPQQAKDFYKAVKAIGADAEFLFVPNENHISEMINVMEPNDLTGQALLKFIK